jgi:hypothetical protein
MVDMLARLSSALHRACSSNYIYLLVVLLVVKPLAASVAFTILPVHRELARRFPEKRALGVAILPSHVFLSLAYKSFDV